MARSRAKGKVKPERPDFVTKTQMTDQTCPDCTAEDFTFQSYMAPHVPNPKGRRLTDAERKRVRVAPQRKRAIAGIGKCETCAGTGRVQMQRVIAVPRRKPKPRAA